MSGTEYYDNLTFSYRVGENHENQPALFCGVLIAWTQVVDSIFLT